VINNQRERERERRKPTLTQMNPLRRERRVFAFSWAIFFCDELAYEVRKEYE
jgi:hypothetical protein